MYSLRALWLLAELGPPAHAPPIEPYVVLSLLRCVTDRLYDPHFLAWLIDSLLSVQERFHLFKRLRKAFIERAFCIGCWSHDFLLHLLGELHQAWTNLHWNLHQPHLRFRPCYYSTVVYDIKVASYWGFASSCPKGVHAIIDPVHHRFDHILLHLRSHQLHRAVIVSFT